MCAFALHFKLPSDAFHNATMHPTLSRFKESPRGYLIALLIKAAFKHLIFLKQRRPAGGLESAKIFYLYSLDFLPNTVAVVFQIVNFTLNTRPRC